MTEQDVRWLQRFNNFRKAFNQLDSAVQLSEERELSDLEKQGLIQAFEYTYELSWNMIRDYFRWQGNTGITGSRDAIREAFANGLIEDGDGWMRMLKDRNRTSHTYNEETAQEILKNILQLYHPLFGALQTRMADEAKKHDLA
ncbi:MAG: nucleotidyltransferase substrate binding protein [Marinobacter sp. T13-3]|nr:MAG: nucleotidyltransferase substrate binding protein [Marinobacter sp. T13-3]